MVTEIGAAFTAAVIRKEGLDCHCGVVVTITNPAERVPLLWQLRRAWFAHMREQHNDEYSKLRGPRRSRGGNRGTTR